MNRPAGYITRIDERLSWRYAATAAQWGLVLTRQPTQAEC